MNHLSMICILIGIIAVLFRAPMVFAPKAVMRLTKEKLALNKTRMRLLGLFLICLGLAMILAAWESGLLIGQIIVIWGFLIMLVPLILMVIFPGVYGRILIYFSRVNSFVIRAIGILGVAIGTLFLYFGFFVLWG